MTKSCSTCPSFLSPTDAAQRLGRGLGTAQCGKFATPLGIPTVPGAKPELAIAESCSAHNSYATASPISYDGLVVALPDPQHIVPDPDPQAWSHMSVQSCASCIHYVDEVKVEAELGWTAGMCKAKGRLIPINRVTIESRTCSARTAGINALTTDGCQLLPQYERYVAVVAPRDSFFNATSSVKEFANPQTYETDKPVEPHQVEVGIRAWRRISDPNMPTRYTYLPIFDPASFDDADRAKIPQAGDDEHPELYKDHGGLLYTAAVLLGELDETPALWGEPGTGKTEFARHLAWTMGLPFERISVTATTELDELAGKMRYTPEQGTFFQPGRVPEAWVKRCVMLVDEPNVGPPPVWHFLRPLTDNSRQLIMDLDDHSRRDRDDNCYLLLAMNPAWDPRNRGAEEIADADVSRLSHIFFELPPDDVERKILNERVALDNWSLTDDQLDSLMGVAGELRALSRDLTIPVSWGLRNQIKVARFLNWFTPVEAYRRATADYLEPKALEAMLDVVRAHFGEV